jgi:restriction system protein
MSRKKESLIDDLLKAPWWVSVVLGVVAYVAVRFVLPAFFSRNPVLGGLVGGFAQSAHFILWFFGFIAVLSALFGLRRRDLVNDQRSVETLRATPWKDFEYLVAEACRRQGYAVDYSLGRGADGGVDMVLRRDGCTSLLQCKQWRAGAVGVAVVREMYGILMAQKADEVIVVATGRFTAEARSFAVGKPIRLIDGPALLELVRSVQPGDTLAAKSANAVPLQELPDEAAPKCPKCGGKMVKRVARRGVNAGKEFWGCEKYPNCTGSRSM